MRIKVKRTLLDIRVLFAAAVTLMLLTDSSTSAALALAACALHECGHLACMLLLGDYPYSVTLSFFGARIERRAGAWLSLKKELLITLSGPAVNLAAFAALAGIERLRAVAAANVLVGAFNLLPCYPLDGGRVLFEALNFFARAGKAEKVCRAVSVAVICAMAVFSVLLLVHSKNFTLLAVTLYLAGAAKSGEKFMV